MTEPEQWAVELFRKAVYEYGGQSIPGETECYAARVIQRAFQERERELREAAGELLSAQDAIDNWRGVDEGLLWWQALERRRAAFLATSRALATRQDAPTENSHEEQ